MFTKNYNKQNRQNIILTILYKIKGGIKIKTKVKNDLKNFKFQIKFIALNKFKSNYSSTSFFKNWSNEIVQVSIVLIINTKITNTTTLNWTFLKYTGISDPTKNIYINFLGSYEIHISMHLTLSIYIKYLPIIF